MLLVLLGICVGVLLLALPLDAATLDGLVDGLTALAVAVAALLALHCWSACRPPSNSPERAPVRRRLRAGWLLPLTLLLLGIASGVQHAAGSARAQLALRVPLCADARFEEVELTVLSRPVVVGADQPADRRGTRFEARVDAHLLPQGCANLSGRRLRLSWYGAPEVSRGQRWRVTARIRPPWSFQNPGGFDYERWLLGRGLHGTGYVRDGELRKDIQRSGQGSGQDGVERFAGWLLERDVHHRGIVLALAYGDDSAISQSTWDALRSSGTVHLVVVSGLHVGMVASIVFLLVRVSCRAFADLLLWYDGQRVASTVSIAAAAVFVLISGSGVPALRAWIMAAVGLLAVSAGRRWSVAVLYLITLGMILLLEPLVVHQQGFWLSFAAVGLLLGFFGTQGGWKRLPDAGARGKVKAALAGLARTQWVLLVGLSPLLAWQQLEVPSAAAVANLLVVPLVSMFALPLVLMLALVWQRSELAATALLAVLEPLLKIIMGVIEAASNMPLMTAGAERAWPFLLALPAGCVLLGVMGWRWRLLALLAWCGWLVPATLAVPWGEFRLQAFDVGQGSALSVDTRRHRLLFDVAPRFPGGFDLGAAVVVPSLIATGPLHVDTLVLSHSDLDHTGGTAALLARATPDTLYTSFPLSLPAAVQQPATLPCHAGVDWEWDGVTFEFINHPLAGSSDNDGSCVLLIATATRRALLAGDIGRAAERRLLSAQMRSLDVDLLMAPHHGSNGSSSAGWIRATLPEVVFVSAPRRSRYGHPHPAVIDRYRDVGARLWITGRSGALEWRSWDAARVGQARIDAAPWWINQSRPRASHQAAQ